MSQKAPRSSQPPILARRNPIPEPVSPWPVGANASANLSLPPSMSTPSTKKRMLQRKGKSMAASAVDSPISPSPLVQPLLGLSGDPGAMNLLAPTPSETRSETRPPSDHLFIPAVSTPSMTDEQKADPFGNRHATLTTDSTSNLDYDTIRNRSVSRPTETRPAIRAALDVLKNMEEENVKLKSEVQQLSSRLQTLQAETDLLLVKNRTLQVRSKEIVDTTAETLEVNFKELKAYKTQCASQAAALEELTSAKSDFHGLRDHVQALLAEIKPLIQDREDESGWSTLTRQTIADIHNEIQAIKTDSEKKQHVIDILREQLIRCTGDLSEARDRVFTLENELSKSRVTLEKTGDEAANAVSKISLLANELQTQQYETILAFSRSEELQMSLRTAESDLQHLRHKLTESEDLTQTLRTECTVLQHAHQQATSQASRIPELEASLQRFSTMKAAMKAKDDLISDIHSRLSSWPAVEAELRARDRAIAELEISLKSARMSEKAAEARISALECAQANLKLVTAENVKLQKVVERSTVFEELLISAKQELEREKAARLKVARDAEVAENRRSSLEQTLRSTQDMLQRSNTRFEISEQRRVDQVEDLTTRLAANEVQLTSARESISKYSSEAASLAASLTEIRHVADKREGESARLQAAIQTHVSTRDEQSSPITKLQAELKERSQALQHSESLRSTYEARDEKWKRGLRESDGRLADATSKLQKSEAEISTLKVQVQTLAQIPAHNEDNDRLRVELQSAIERADVAEGRLAEQEDGLKTLVTRFRAREKLSDLETSIIGDIVALVRAQCGKEVLAQINEIKGRDTTIGKLTTRVAQLEGLLENAMRDSEAGKIAPKSRSKEKKDDSQALEVATPMSDPPAPDADEVTADSSPPSPPLAARHILNLPGPSGAVRQYGSSRPATVVTRHQFAEISEAPCSSQDLLSFPSSDDLVVDKAHEPGVRKSKRSHDDMGYGGDIDDEDESRPATIVTRHKFAEISKAPYSSQDLLSFPSSDDLVVDKAHEPGVRKSKRSHDDMEYGEDIDDEDEGDGDDTLLKNVTLRNKVKETTWRASVQNKQVGMSAATTANNGTSKSRGKKRR
ncbi:hypothetical protein FRB90_006604 [Tulasnella sp. 427]|nr:hypothetical protein FRB90_006604 [Tulasnella sp. 427]